MSSASAQVIDGSPESFLCTLIQISSAPAWLAFIQAANAVCVGKLLMCFAFGTTGGMVVTSYRCFTTVLNAASRRQVFVDPGRDVRQHALLADVIEQIVEVTLIELERLVFGSGRFVEELAALADRRIVHGPVHDQHRQRDERKL